MKPETKEACISILFGILGIGLGAWLCWLSVTMIGACALDDYIGLVAGTVVGAMGVVLVMASAGLVLWMVGELVEKGSCDADG